MCFPGPLITTAAGKPISRGGFGDQWRAAVERAGLPKGTRYHDLRHWYASRLIGAGLSVKVVQSRLGHSTATETLNCYSHLWPDDAEIGRGVIESAFTCAQDAHISTTNLTP